MTCLSDEKLEVLARGQPPIFRGWFWKRHLGRCVECRERLSRLQDDLQFLDTVRSALDTETRLKDSVKPPV